MWIYLLRHGPTQGNLEGNYIGRTDQPILPDAVPPQTVPKAQRVYCSPMLRCKQSAALLYPEIHPVILEKLRECDFGAFEGKNYHQLKDDPAYREWLASGGKISPPGGEEIQAFKDRCCQVFRQAVNQSFRDKMESVAFVTHGGVIMSILEHFGPSTKGFYDWQVPNWGGWAIQERFYIWTEIQTLRDPRRI